MPNIIYAFFYTNVLWNFQQRCQDNPMGEGGEAVFFKEENFFQITRQSHARKDEFRPLPHIIHDN